MSLLEEASDSVNSLCLKLYAKLTENNVGNVFFSPSSVSIALAMAYAGAKGKTATEIEQVMSWNNHKNVHEMMQQLQDCFFSSSDTELSLANRLWAKEGFAILKQYAAALLTSQYRIEMGTADFERKTEEARKSINEWVEGKTNNKIKDILELGAITPDTNMVLVSAVYFNGLWEEQFLREDSIDWDFQMSSTNTCKKHMLRVSVPRFTAECKFRLKPILGELGVIDLFSSNNADLSGVTGSKGLFVSDVIHQAFVNVNEQGTEAAAATAMIMAPTGIMMPLPHFLADHPFLFFIQDCQSGAILFAGKFASPT